MGQQFDILLGWRYLDVKEKVTQGKKEDELEDFLCDYQETFKGSGLKTTKYIKEKYNFSGKLPDLSLFFFREDDMGYEEKDWLYAVSLTSRYNPIFLDFRDPTGGLFCTEIDKDFLEDIEEARKILIQHNSDFATAKIFIRDHWY